MNSTIDIYGAIFLCLASLALLMLVVNITLATIMEWREGKIHRMRQQLECERLKRELIKSEGRKAEL